MTDDDIITKAATHFSGIVKDQLSRIENLKGKDEWLDFRTVNPIVIGIVGGDGIGPEICNEARRILEFLLEEEVNSGNIEFRTVEGLTIENRAKVKKAVPDGVLNQITDCHVLLKGPTTTPKKGDGWPNIESANVALRRELDLFANVRPVKVPEHGIDWIFFRENTEGAYILGSRGINVTDDLAVDFTVTTTQGSRRILEMAFEYASKNDINRVTVVTKANVIKTTDGKFLAIAEEVANKYPNVKWDDWFIDIMTAKLIDNSRRSEFKVVVMPNLYGDIITDEAAQIQGGVGTAGSANIGKRYAMFEAIHGSAPRMVEEGRAKYADPRSMMRAVVMLLNHIGYPDKADKLEKALDICGVYEKKLEVTGRPEGATAEEFSSYIQETLQGADIDERWDTYRKNDRKD